MDATTDYLSDAPDYTAWAGRGPLAEAIGEEGGDLEVEFRGRVNAVVDHLVDHGAPVAEAITAYDPESIAAALLAEVAPDLLDAAHRHA